MPHFFASLRTLFEKARAEPPVPPPVAPQPPRPLDVPVVKACLKWEWALEQANISHTELQYLSVQEEPVRQMCQHMLADYAEDMMYAALMRGQLAQLMPGAGDDDFRAVLEQCRREPLVNGDLMGQIYRELDQEIPRECSALKRRLGVEFSTLPLPSLQEALHQGTLEPSQAQPVRQVM